MKIQRLTVFAFLGILLSATPACRADMALLIEDPAGYKGFWSDSGHLAIWISDACIGSTGTAAPCSTGGGVILSSTSYWTATGWAAIPLETYLNGVPGKSADSAWSDTLHETYPEVPINYGRKYIGRLNHRGSYVIRIHTTPAQDAAVLERVQAGRGRFRYAVWSSNCSDFAREVLDLYFPGSFRRRPIPDFGISTPRGVANRFWKLGHRHPDLRMRVYYIPRRHGSYLHDGRTKGICEAAITDTKYALPLIFYQPLIYGAFGLCYLTTDQPRFMRRGFSHEARRVTSFASLNSDYEDRFAEKMLGNVTAEHVGGTGAAGRAPPAEEGSWEGEVHALGNSIPAGAGNSLAFTFSETVSSAP